MKIPALALKLQPFKYKGKCDLRTSFATVLCPVVISMKPMGMLLFALFINSRFV